MLKSVDKLSRLTVCITVSSRFKKCYMVKAFAYSVSAMHVGENECQDLSDIMIVNAITSYQIVNRNVYMWLVVNYSTRS